MCVSFESWCEMGSREGGDWNGDCRIAETLPGLAPGEPGNHLGEGEGVRKLFPSEKKVDLTRICVSFTR